MGTPITLQNLIDAASDVTTLATVVNSTASTVVTREGTTVPTILGALTAMNVNYRGAYAAGTTYNRLDTVMYVGNGYVSIVANNTANEPDTSPAQWALYVGQAQQGASLPQLAGIRQKLPTGVNLFNADTVSSGFYVDAETGALDGGGTYPGLTASDFIVANAGGEMACNLGLPNGSGASVDFYDEAFNFLGNTNSIATALAPGSPFTVPATAAYLRVTLNNDDVAGCMIVAGTTLPSTFQGFAYYPSNVVDGLANAIPLTDSANAVLTTVSVAGTYATPPVTLEETVGTLYPVLQATTTLQGVVINVGTAATQASVLRSVSAVFATALVGRTIEFYVLVPDGSGNYVVTFASGLQAAPNAGIVTYSPPNEQAVRCPVGAVLGIWNSAVNQADGIFSAQSGGQPDSSDLWNPTGTQLSVGGAYSSSNTPEDPYLIPALSALVVHEATLVPTRWANLPGGWAQLDSNGGVPTKVLPTALSESPTLSLANGNIEQLVFDPTTLLTKNVITANNAPVTFAQVYDGANGDQTGVALQNTILVSYLNTSPGFTQGGILTNLQFPPVTGNLGSSPVLQVWIIRPTEAPTAGSNLSSFTLVGIVGQVSRVDTISWVEFADLAISVEPGDLVAVRGINSGIVWGGASTAYDDYMMLEIASSDMTLNALNAGGVTSLVVGPEMIAFSATIQPSAYVLTNSTRVPDVFGNQPSYVARPVDNPWFGKKAIANGTSITASNPVSGEGNPSILTGSGYIAQAFRNLSTNGLNHGIGSSQIVWNPATPDQLALSATIAELTAAFSGAVGQAYSYQALMIGLDADLIIFDHGYNDRLNPIGTLLMVDGVTPNTDRTTYYGAANYLRAAMKADRPTCRWVWTTPISLFNPAVGAGVVDSYVNGWDDTNAIRAANLALAAYWKDPILDWSNDFELNWDGIQPASLTYSSTETTDEPTYMGAYSPTTPYSANQSVVDQYGRTYISLVDNNTGNAPTYGAITVSGVNGNVGNAFWVLSGHTLDGIHPDQSRHDLAARRLYRFLLTA